MKNFSINLGWVMFTALYLLQSEGNSQCGYTNEAEIVNYQVANRSFQDIEVRVQVYAIMNDEGTLGVTASQAGTSMAAVATDFKDNYNIKLNYCIREIRSTDAYEFKRFPRPECISNSIYVELHENCTQFACGQAFISLPGQILVPGAWAVNVHATIMHELGHVFGLNHTHNNSHIRDESCKTKQGGPIGCAETVQQRNCNADGPKTCLIDGDGICDTPADPLCYTNTLCSNPFAKDRCGLDYPNPISDTLTKNYMSYYSPSRIQFTTDQKNQMHGYISAKYQYAIGEWTSCLNSTLTYEELGFFTENKVFENQELYFGDGIFAKDCTIYFRNCIVHLGQSLKLENALLFFDHNTIFKAGATSICDGAQSTIWNGIKLTNSSVLGVKGSLLESNDPVISSIYNTPSLIWLDDVNVNGDKVAIDQQGDAGLVLTNDCNINGRISKLNFSIPSGPYAYFGGLHIQNSKVSKNSGDLSTTGIQVWGADAIFENSELSNFGIGLAISGNSTIIHHSVFKNISGDAIKCTNSSYIRLTDSHVNDSYLYIDNPTAINIKNNNFNNSPSEGIYLSNKDDVKHTISNNKFVGNQKGILTNGKQTGLKMLCNSFSNISRDFEWQNDVDPLQANEQGKAAGNIFSSGITQVAGMSDVEVQYNFKTFTSNEEPINVTHTNFRKLPVTLEAGCGTIGASWTPPGVQPPCPPGINCTQPCPLGIDCTQACPPGINCTQPCPVGIDCTPTNPVGCPQGIDCTQPCPIGIDCTEDCPPGIDCTHPCPPGIDCTQPCPLGINCFSGCPIGIDCHKHCPPGIECNLPCTRVEGCHEPCVSCIEPGEPIILPKPCDDPLFTYLESQYNQQEAQYLAQRDSYKTLPNYAELSQLLSQQSLGHKNRIIQLFALEPRLVTTETIKSVFMNSTLYTENEVVNLIKLNPALLLDPIIKPIISKSGTFTSTNISQIQTNFNANAQNPAIGDLWEVDAKKTKMSEILHYGMYRLAYYDMRSCERYNTWLKKFNTLSAEFRIIDNHLSQNNTTEISMIFSQLLADSKYSTQDKYDIQQYKAMTDLLTSVAASGRNLNQLSAAEQQQLQTVALGTGRFSASKAQGILKALYKYTYNKFEDQDEVPDRLYFLDSNVITGRTIKDYHITIAPNPTSGNIIVSQKSDEILSMFITSIDGRHTSKHIIQGETCSLFLEGVVPGVYYYTILNSENKIAKKDKLIIIK